MVASGRRGYWSWTTVAGYGGEHLVEGKSIKEIARDLKISRNTVRKVLRSGATSFAYEREVQPRLKLGRWKGELDRMLIANAAVSARERLTLIRGFEELRTKGCEGGYDAVWRYAKAWARDHVAASARAWYWEETQWIDATLAYLARRGSGRPS